MSNEQQCTHCGTPLAPNAILCPKRGSAEPSFWDTISDIIMETSDATMASACTFEDFDAVNERLEGIEGSIVRLREIVERSFASQVEGGPFEAKAAYSGKLVELGSYPTEADGTKRPIVWKMIAVEPSRALLIAQYVLGCKQFSAKGIESAGKDADGNEITDNFAPDYEDSDLRIWLEDDFLNEAFSQEEKNRIDSSPTLLTLHQTLLLKNLDDEGVYTPYANTKTAEDRNGWWLCTKHNPRANAIIVNGSCLGSSWYDEQGVRPVIWIKLD